MLVPARSHSRLRSSAPTRAALSFGRVAAFGAVESRFAPIAPAHVPASAHTPAGERCLGRLEARQPDCNNGQICDYTATGAHAPSTLPRPQFYGVKLPPDLVAQVMPLRVALQRLQRPIYW